MNPQGPIQPPGGANPNASSPGIGGGFPAAVPAQTNPGMDLLITATQQIVSASRRIGMKFPSAMQEVREINNLVARIQQKVQETGPAPEPMAPPI